MSLGRRIKQFVAGLVTDLVDWSRENAADPLDFTDMPRMGPLRTPAPWPPSMLIGDELDTPFPDPGAFPGQSLYSDDLMARQMSTEEFPGDPRTLLDYELGPKLYGENRREQDRAWWTKQNHVPNPDYPETTFPRPNHATRMREFVGVVERNGVRAGAIDDAPDEPTDAEIDETIKEWDERDAKRSRLEAEGALK